ncbi:MAG: hypothetical protein ACLP22_25085 [Solirubrobacteraceae bacterium]
MTGRKRRGEDLCCEIRRQLRIAGSSPEEREQQPFVAFVERRKGRRIISRRGQDPLIIFGPVGHLLY